MGSGVGIMAVKFDINADSIAVKMTKAWESGREEISALILKDCNDYCKMDSGALIMSSYIHSRLKEGLLIWQTPYAARQYYEIPTAYTDNGNPNATWRWCEVAKANHAAEWVRQAEAIKRYYK